MRNLIVTIIFFVSLFAAESAYAQFGVGETPGLEFNDSTEVVKVYDPVERCHLIGVNYSCGFGGLYISPTQEIHREFSPMGVGFTYTYLHDLWGIFSIFGIQTGLRYSREGFSYEYKDGTTYNTTFMEVIELPVTSLFHYEILNDRVRLMINAGPYIGYRLSIDRPYMEDEGYVSNVWMPSDIRFDYGIKGGAGIALVFSPIEIHIEGTYKQSYSNLFAPDRDSKYYYTFATPSQILISVGLHVQFGRKYVTNDKM